MSYLAWIELLAHSDDGKLVEKLLRPESLVFLVAIASVVVWGVVALVKALLRHKERIAMIRAGMNPNVPPESNSSEEGV